MLIYTPFHSNTPIYCHLAHWFCINNINPTPSSPASSFNICCTWLWRKPAKLGRTQDTADLDKKARIHIGSRRMKTGNKNHKGVNQQKGCLTGQLVVWVGGLESRHSLHTLRDYWYWKPPRNVGWNRSLPMPTLIWRGNNILLISGLCPNKTWM